MGIFFVYSEHVTKYFDFSWFFFKFQVQRKMKKKKEKVSFCVCHLTHFPKLILLKMRFVPLVVVINVFLYREMTDCNYLSICKDLFRV